MGLYISQGKGCTVLVNKDETYPEQGNKVSYVSRTIARVKQGMIQEVVVVME